MSCELETRSEGKDQFAISSRYIAQNFNLDILYICVIFDKLIYQIFDWLSYLITTEGFFMDWGKMCAYIIACKCLGF